MIEAATAAAGLILCVLQKRHQADNETNHRQVDVLRDGRWMSVQWLGVEVGDIVKVQNDSFFPADMMLLSSRQVVLSVTNVP
jgi:magnesium-transporting ATPase (P-type)